MVKRAWRGAGAGVPGWAGAEDAAGCLGVASRVGSWHPRVSVEDRTPGRCLRQVSQASSCARLPSRAPSALACLSSRLPARFFLTVSHLSGTLPLRRGSTGNFWNPRGLHPGVHIRLCGLRVTNTRLGPPACRQRPGEPRFLGLGSAAAKKEGPPGSCRQPQGGPRAPGLSGRPQNMRMPRVPWGGLARARA